MDVIFALASARGKAGVSVLRLSGAGTHRAVAQFCSLPPLRHAALRKLRWGGEILDDAVVLIFAEGASFTGEESAELHLHGSTAVVSAVMGALGAIEGLRLAEPGEFTRRALENGCLDLTQVEGLADLIDAETEAQRRQALRVLSGAVGQRVEAWRRDLVRAAALIEATIDFADEEVPLDVRPEVGGLVSNLIEQLSRELRGAKAAERIRDGFEVAIVGAPNAGKSTLLNALAGREAAITSDIAGTTRDVIEVRLDLGGLAVTVLDTAGLRESTDRIERMGVDRALLRARAADMRIFLLQHAEEALMLEAMPGDIVLLGKADERQNAKGAVSGLTGYGIDALVEAIQARLTSISASAGIVIRERQRIALERALVALSKAQERLVHAILLPEMVSIELRDAMRALEILLGRVDVETLLDEIFSSFCIGK